MRQKITKTVVESLLPGTTVTDSALDGFRVRAHKTGKVYSVQKRIGSRVVTRTIGKHGVYMPEQARQAARKILLELSQGIDPLAAKRREQQKRAVTFGDLLDLYVRERTLSDATARDIKNKVCKHLAPWVDMPAVDITRRLVLDRFSEVLKRGATQGALVARYARAIFNFGIEYHTDERTGESLIPHNPILALTALKKLPKPRRRETFIDTTALRKWLLAWATVRKAKPTHCDYIITTLLLGCRKNEAAKLRWVDVNLEEQYVRFSNTKNGTDHLMPVGPFLADVLEKRYNTRPKACEFVFPSRITRKRGSIDADLQVHGRTTSDIVYAPLVDVRKTMAKISLQCGVRFMMSDLRRTFATHCAALGIAYFDIKRLLNHKFDNREATPGYIIVELGRKREQVVQLEEFVDGLMEPQEQSLPLAVDR